MFIKICGTTNLDDALLSADLGADALGFIFAPSKRQVTAEQARAIARQLPPHPLLVGVFTEPNVEQIVKTASTARLAALQMHWRYDPQLLDALYEEIEGAAELWQVVGFQVNPVHREEAEQQFQEDLRAALLNGRLDCILLDALKGNTSGGLGLSFPWARAATLIYTVLLEVEDSVRSKPQNIPKLTLAGGLNADNVRQAIEIVQPWGVDVVSGVEASPGKKSPDRLRAFMQSARKASS